MRILFDMVLITHDSLMTKNHLALHSVRYTCLVTLKALGLRPIFRVGRLVGQSKV